MLIACLPALYAMYNRSDAEATLLCWSRRPKPGLGLPDFDRIDASEIGDGADDAFARQRESNRVQQRRPFVNFQWVSERVITYDGVPAYAVSVMEFTGDLVTHEPQYFAGPFQAPPWRAALAEPILGRDR